MHFFALGFGSGILPRAPGTWGSALGVVLFLPMSALSLAAQAGVIIVASLIGIYLCGRSAEKLGVHDHGAIVWDEFVGQWIVLAYAQYLLGSLSCLTLLVCFLLFRVFDVLKPWPIRWADKHVHGGAGIMLDDILAAVPAMLCLYGVYRLGFPL